MTDKITPMEDRALTAAGDIVAAWHNTQHNNLGALIRRVAAALMLERADAYRAGLERAAEAVKAEANALSADASPDYYDGYKRALIFAIRAIRAAASEGSGGEG